MVTSPSEKLLVSVRDHVAQLTITSPAANTWDVENLDALHDVVEALDADQDVYALVITGKGEKFFSAGADLKLFADGDKGNAATVAGAFGRAFERLANFGGVSVAAVNGYAMGGGLECALACDIRVAERQAILALPEATVGLLPSGGGTQNLPWVVGEAWAKRMILCGERVDAETALRIGLVEEIVDQGQSLGRALELAAMVAKQSPPAVRASKSLIQHARVAPMGHGYARERELFVQLFDTDDQTEGVNAFLEKRPAQWTNR